MRPNLRPNLMPNPRPNPRHPHSGLDTTIKYLKNTLSTSSSPTGEYNKTEIFKMAASRFVDVILIKK
jgi:hypothetical protein